MKVVISRLGSPGQALDDAGRGGAALLLSRVEPEHAGREIDEALDEFRLGVLLCLFASSPGFHQVSKHGRQNGIGPVKVDAGDQLQFKAKMLHRKFQGVSSVEALSFRVPVEILIPCARLCVCLPHHHRSILTVASPGSPGAAPGAHQDVSQIGVGTQNVADADRVFEQGCVGFSKFDELRDSVELFHQVCRDEIHVVAVGDDNVHVEPAASGPAVLLVDPLLDGQVPLGGLLNQLRFSLVVAVAIQGRLANSGGTAGRIEGVLRAVR